MIAGHGKWRCRFQLRPFVPIKDSKRFSLGGWVDRRPGVLSIDYRVEGALPDIVWPNPQPFPVVTRCHDLWRQTCFEFFFAIPGDMAYWEVNLSPNGSWNVYHFSAYRQGMEEEQRIDQILCQVCRGNTSLALSCRVDLSLLVPDSAGLEVAIAGVVRGIDGTTGYWAIDHPETVPDFHSRQSFLLSLPRVDSAHQYSQCDTKPQEVA